MEMKIVGFEVLEADGGGMHEISLAIFAHKADAKLLANKNPHYRRVVPIDNTIIVHEDFSSYENAHMKKERERILAKLSYEERRILGV